MSKLRDPAPPLARIRIADEALAAEVRRALEALDWRVVSDEAAEPAALLVTTDMTPTDGSEPVERILLDAAASFDTVTFAEAVRTRDPRETIAPARRLAALFGEEAIAASLLGLRNQLAEALDDADAARAHRIAGVAGTLGFARASAAWLDVSEGDLSAQPAALLEARRAILAIDTVLES